MSFKVLNILKFPQPTLQCIPHDALDISCRELPLIGGILSDTRHVWHAKGPCIEVRDTKTGIKVGAWTFGCILKDPNTKVVCVDEIQRPNGRLSLLAVGVECAINGSLICVFDIFGSKVIRAIQIKEKITSLHVVDSGCEVLNLPGPLRNFDGILAVGTKGGNVFLVDICRQICEEALYAVAVRDELCPSQLILLTAKDSSRIEYYKEQSVREGDHLAIHLNVVLNSLTQHFVLKGPKEEDRIHVNREEVITSALYHCPQLKSLLVGFNFGAFQLWDLTTLKLVYTSPVCEEHLPITHFALQEPADDPRAFCYIWVSYSNINLFEAGLPFAVMYSFCYESKEYHEGYGYLYQDFQLCSVRFQIELGQLEEHRSSSKVRGGYCVGLQPIYKVSANKDLYFHDSVGDTLTLCVISWTVWFNQSKTETCMLLFDLNQWYKEQMPEFRKWADCSSYILKVSVSGLANMKGYKAGPFLDAKVDKKSLRQFTGVQRLEEHFCPNALSFALMGIRENDAVLLESEGVQKALLAQIEATGPLCLIRPNDLYRQVIALGLIPLFTDLLNTSTSTEVQREVILNVGLEHQLVCWLCKCASEWANGSFSSAGCSLDFLIYWAFQRAVTLKTNCDKYCTPLFDYSQSRLDNNTSILLNSCMRQIDSLCTFYSFVINKLYDFVSNSGIVIEQYNSLKMVLTYFEVLQWLVNVGLLPECHPSTYARPNSTGQTSAPYPVQQLTDYYNERRAYLQLLGKEAFVSSDSLLFIDSLINHKCGAESLQKQWEDDGGNGLYPPPSLQSMLRTYLVQGTDASHKHSLVIYLFLDLAMALDQSRYASVITHLIKFPAVFKVSSSIIKITQAFWQLDHGDFTTAMEQLLDPFVLDDDLEPWHHAIAMRALLVQNQYNFALHYMQVRKPPVVDDKDVLTAISLFIANGMLDEAFYFKNQHLNNNEEKLLMHLFNECNKNESLHVLLNKCLNTNEEKAFFKYLNSVGNPSAEDLQVFYYLLRSRFVEAFDAHHNSRRKKPECQGLIGQRNATRTDQIVRIFKSSLPNINKDIVDVVRKERTNLWREVARPTPLSVFVHNTTEQVQYNSNLIHAALAKAKRTFDDSTYNSKFNDVLTEETPFLRTPTATKFGSRPVIPIIAPKVIEINENGEELGPSPSKRLKLTPRAPTTSPTWSKTTSAHSTMLTPIVKRKTSLQKDSSALSNSNVCTPQSILKVRNLVYSGDGTVADNTLDNFDGLARVDTSPRKSGFHISPRKSLSRTPRRPQVKFDDAARFSSSFSDQSIQPSPNKTTFEDPEKSLSSKDISLIVSSKNSSGSNSEEVYYSPNSSVSEPSELCERSNVVDENNAPKDEIAMEVVVQDNEEKSRAEGSGDVHLLPQSPRARRSYKRSLADTPPVRSSPRLHKNLFTQNEKAIEDILLDSMVCNTNLDSGDKLVSTPTPDAVVQDTSYSTVESSSSKQSPRLLQKVKGRKSLSRKVLEHNTFSKILSTPSVLDSAVTKERSFSSTQTVVISEKRSDTMEVTSLETKIEVSDVSVSDPVTPTTSNRHTETTSVSKRRNLESTYLSSDTSLDITFDSPQLPEHLKLSESLLEFVKSGTCKSNKNDTRQESYDVEANKDLKVAIEDKPELIHRTPVTCRRPSSNSSKTTLFDSDISLEDSPLPEHLKLSDSLLEFVKYGIKKPNTNEVTGDSYETPQECNINKNETEKTDGNSKTLGENKPKTTQIEVSEDLSNGTEDIEEVLPASKSNDDDTRQESYNVEENKDLKVATENKPELIPRTPVTCHTPSSNRFESTPFNSDISLEDSIKLPEHLKLSDSLLEFVKYGTKKPDTNKVTGDSHEMPQKERNITKNEPEKTDESSKTLGENKPETAQIEVYEDLSSGTEDIQEVLTASKREQYSSKTLMELSNALETAHDKLEENVHEVTKEQPLEEQTGQDIQNSSASTAPDSEAFDIPESEKAFIDDQTKLETSGLSIETCPESEKAFIAEGSVIEISSSSDNEGSVGQSDTSESRSSEKSESDGDNLNISYERNIHVEENSRSLADSDSTRTSGGRLSVSDEAGDNHAEVEEDMRHDVDSSNDGVLELNEDNSSVEWAGNGQRSEDEDNALHVDNEAEEREELEGRLVEREFVDNTSNGAGIESRELLEIEGVVDISGVCEDPAGLAEEDGTLVVMVEDEIEAQIENETTNNDVEKTIISQQQECEDDSQKSINTTELNNKLNNEVENMEVELEAAASKKNNTAEDKKEETELLIQEDNVENKTETDQTKDEEPPRVQHSDQLDVSSAEISGKIAAKEEMQIEEKQKDTQEKQTNTTHQVLSDKTTSIEENRPGKKDQSTNTTFIAGILPKQRKAKVERSTNTTASLCEPSPSSKNDKIVCEADRPEERTSGSPSSKNDESSVWETERPKERRMYHPKYGTMKVVTEDQTVSSVSSGTTEGETSREIVVAAQVHAPSNKNVDESTAKWVPREISVVLDTTDITMFPSCSVKDQESRSAAQMRDKADDSNIKRDTNDAFTPARRTRRSLSATVTPAASVKTRRSSFQNEKREDLDQPTTSKGTHKDFSRTPRKTRSVSTDDINTLSSKRRSLRSNSTDESVKESPQEHKPKPRGKAASVSQLPVITEERKKHGGKRSTSAIEAYATTRRLTRRQASLVKGIETPSSVTAQDDSDVEKVLDVDAIDPINLLDKEPFQGKPDPEEQKVYEASSPSNSTVSSFNVPAKRASRSASMASDSSLPPSASLAGSPSTKGIKTRSRRKSETSSVVSEKSSPPTPPKRARRKSTNSNSSIKSDASKSPKTHTRSRRLVSAKSDLPEIVEESAKEAGESGDKHTSKRQTKKKSGR